MAIHPLLPSRRQLLAGLSAASIGGIAHAGQASAPAEAGRIAATGLDPGLAYLNTGSLGPTPPLVLERVLDAWRTIERNPVVSAYGAGAAGAMANEARERAARLIGADPDQLLVTTGATAGMNAIAGSVRLARGEAVLTTDQEHHGGTAGWEYRKRRDGVRIDRIAVPPGEADADAILARIEAAIRPETRVISVSHVLYTTGFRMPVAAISALARARGLLCVVDGAQAVGAIAVDVRAIGCHAYAASGHKWLMGPKGTGLLHVSADAAGRIEPMQWELGRQYVAESAGVGPIALAAGLVAAIEAIEAVGIAEVERRVLALRDHFQRGLAALPGVTMASPPPGPLASGLVSIVLPDALEARPLLIRMRERAGVVARAIPREWFNGLRFSTHIFNTENEIARALAALRAELG